MEQNIQEVNFSQKKTKDKEIAMRRKKQESINNDKISPKLVLVTVTDYRSIENKY